MKNLFKNLMLVAVAAMGFTACEQVIDDVNVSNEKFTVNIVGEFADDTRSGFVGSETNDGNTFYKSAWDGNETVRFALIPDTFADTDKANYIDVENTTAGNSASFNNVEFDSNEGTIHAFSPKGVYNSTDASACEGGFTSTNITLKYQNVYVVVPAVQTPRENSVDPAVHLLAGKADFADNVVMTFEHVAAYGKMTIKNFVGDIDKVEVTASEPLAGISCYYNYDGDKEGQLTNASDCTITLKPDYVAKNVFWFGCAPADLSEGTLKVKIYSGEDTYTKELKIANKNFKFQQGRVASFGVDMKDVEADVVTISDGDIITRDVTGVGKNSSTYTNWKDKEGVSGAVYNGNSAGGNDAIQLRSNTNSGIITTVSGGKVRKVTVVWQDGTTNGRTLNIYGKNTPYADTSELYDEAKCGTLLGTIVKGTSTELNITEDYEFIGMRSNANAMYISEIKIEWENDGLQTQTISFPESTYTITEGDSFTAPTLSGAQTNVTYTSSNTEVATVDANTGAVTVVGVGETTIKATAIEANGYRSAEASYTLIVNKPGAKTYTLQFGTAYNSKAISAYNSSWYVTCDSFIWDIVNANNNNNGWNYIKMGSKNAAYVGEITTRNAMPEAIKTITMTVDAVTIAKINSINLYVATDNGFNQKVHTISVTPAKGDLTFTIPTPTANCFYKIEVDCQKGSSNGLIQISKVVYTNE